MPPEQIRHEKNLDRPIRQNEHRHARKKPGTASPVYVVTDGFEGDTVKEGDKKNWRLVNGWKNSGLPWGYTLNKGELSS